MVHTKCSLKTLRDIEYAIVRKMGMIVFHNAMFDKLKLLDRRRSEVFELITDESEAALGFHTIISHDCDISEGHTFHMQTMSWQCQGQLVEAWQQQ